MTGMYKHDSRNGWYQTTLLLGFSMDGTDGIDFGYKEIHSFGRKRFFGLGFILYALITYQYGMFLFV